jgi:hypothetical protein
MAYASITVKYKNEPKGNARSWSLKDADGNYWGLPKALADKVIPGDALEILYEERHAGGNLYKDIKEIRPRPLAVAPAAAPANGHAAGPNPTEIAKARDIFLTGVVQQAMGSGKFAIGDIGPLTQAALHAWATAHGERPAAPAQAAAPAADPFGDRWPARGAA